MKKYYVIKLSYDHGFWNEEKQDFVGWLNATKYENKDTDGTISIVKAIESASSKKPVTIYEVYENE